MPADAVVVLPNDKGDEAVVIHLIAIVPHPMISKTVAIKNRISVLSRVLM